MASPAAFLFALFAVVLLHTVHVDAISCQVCNSEDVMQRDCADSFSGDYLQDCSMNGTSTVEHTLCRKYSQDIQGELRVQRSCAVNQESVVDSSGCSYRSGTKKIFVVICTCNEDGCNGAGIISSFSAGLLTSLAGAVAMVMRHY